MAERQGFEEQALERIVGMIDPMIDAAAGMMGTPPASKRYTADEQLAEWNYSPIASPQQRVEAMLTMKAQGKSDEEITDTVYPNRRRLITTGRPRVQEQIAFAKEMTRLMGKKAAEFAPPPMDAQAVTVPQAQPRLAPTPEELPFAAPDAPLPPFQLTPPTPAPPAPPTPGASMLDMPVSMIGG